jgi:hypothetical protein
MLAELKQRFVNETVTEQQIEDLLNQIDVETIRQELDTMFVVKVWDRQERLNDVDPEVFIERFAMAPEAFAYVIQNKDRHTTIFQPFVPHVAGVNLFTSEEEALKYGLAEKEEKVNKLLLKEVSKLIESKL